MEDNKTKNLIPDEAIIRKIFIFREKKVMLDRDLAILYEVEPRALNQAVKRNILRFPPDFMFQLNKQETDSLRSQFMTLKRGQHSKYLPYAFSENGVAMLSSVLKSEKAIMINIQIMRAFTKMREMFESLKENRELIDEMKRDYNKRFSLYHRVIEAHSKDIQIIYKLLTPSEEPEKDEIGFKTDRGK